MFVSVCSIVLLPNGQIGKSSHVLVDLTNIAVDGRTIYFSTETLVKWQRLRSSLEFANDIAVTVFLL